MPPAQIELRRTDDFRDAVHRAVQALAEGGLVAFPTETVYVLAANGLSEQGVARLLAATGRGPEQPLTLAIKGDTETRDYVPHAPPLAERLARRCWPGPVTLVFDDNHPESLLLRLPPTARQAVCPHETVALRCPAHECILEVMRLAVGPLLLAGARPLGGQSATTVEDVLAHFSEQLRLVLDDGACQFSQPATVAHVQGAGLKILRPGVVSESTLRYLSSYMVLMVCTGNTCRSPMGEVMLKQHLAKRLGCHPGELEERGVYISSAGIAAMAGGRATPEAAETMLKRGLDLSGHESQPLSDRLVRHADTIIVMTRSHQDAIIVQWPEAAPRVRTLRADGGDVADPIGGPLETYIRCAEQIDAELDRLVDTLELPGSPTDQSR